MLTFAILLALAGSQSPVHVSGTSSFQSANMERGRRLQQRREGRAEELASREERLGSIRADRQLRYGPDPRQRVLFFQAPQGTERPPLAVFVHGGGWQRGMPELVAEKPAWFRQHGWAFASVGYRLLPEATVEQQAADVGAALRLLREQAAELGCDPDKILLLGHSAGAHLTALVGTDPQFAGSAFPAIRGALLSDGAAYDVVEQIRDPRPMLQSLYRPAFGTDPQRQLALSPIHHVGAPDVPDWLILYATVRQDAASQSERLATALRQSGIMADTLAVETVGRQRQAHAYMNIRMGTPGFSGNAAMLAQMRRIEARPSR